MNKYESDNSQKENLKKDNAGKEKSAKGHFYTGKK